MIVVDDPLFICSVAYVVYFIALGLVHALSFIVMGIFSMLNPDSGNASARSLGAGGVTAFVDALITQLTTLVVTSVVYVFRTILALYPYLLVLVFLAILHENQTQVMLMVKETYNTFLVQTNLVSYVRTLGWFLKVSLEVLGPLWNFLVSTLRLLVYNLGGLLAGDDSAGGAVQRVVQAAGQALAGLSSGVYAWVTMQLDCRFDRWGAAVTAATTDAPCLDYAHRRLDLTAGLAGLQETSLALVALWQTLCPIGAGVVNVLVYPLTDPLLTQTLDAAANAVIQLAWDVADVTQLRCRAATKVGASLVLCVPDAAPFFFYWLAFFCFDGVVLMLGVLMLSVFINPSVSSKGIHSLTPTHKKVRGRRKPRQSPRQLAHGAPRRRAPALPLQDPRRRGGARAPRRRHDRALL